MRALIEYLELLRGTVALWWRFFPILGFWFLTGWALREFAIQATVVLGAKNPIPANLIFVPGLVAWVVCDRAILAASVGSVRVEPGNDEEVRLSPPQPVPATRSVESPPAD